MSERKETDTETVDTEILVVGGGGSGLAAAVAAAEKGAKVLVLEKRRTPGGNSLRARGIFATESHIQKEKKIDARSEELIKAALSYSHGSCERLLLKRVRQ